MAWMTPKYISHLEHTSSHTSFNIIPSSDPCGQESSVTVATGSGLDDPGIESLCRWDFPHPSRPALGSTKPPVQCVQDILFGSKAAGEWLWPPNPSSAEVTERLELYLYSPSGLSWHVLWRTLQETWESTWPYIKNVSARSRRFSPAGNRKTISCLSIR